MHSQTQFLMLKNHIVSPVNKPKENEIHKPNYFWWVLFLLAASGGFYEYVIKKDDGSYELNPSRKEKLEQALEDLEEAEQYALFAKENGIYPCYNCGSQLEIYLLAGEVWKYGYTTKVKRYSNAYLDRWHLQYSVQLIGSIEECMKEEKRKIYNYPLLPENLKRVFKLPRPSGNKQDN